MTRFVLWLTSDKFKWIFVYLYYRSNETKHQLADAFYLSHISNSTSVQRRPLPRPNKSKSQPDELLDLTQFYEPTKKRRILVPYFQYNKNADIHHVCFTVVTYR